MELSILALIVWGEITFLLAGGLILLLLNSVMAKRKGRKSINGLFEKLKTDRAQRLEQIRAGLSEYGMQGDALEEKVKEIDLQERKLFQRIATMYKNRSDGMLSRIDVAVETATRPYYELDIQLPEAGSQGASDAVSDDIDHSEIAKLQEENKQLQDELAVTMDTIGRMLSEYSSMFGTENEGGLDKSKIMQAFNVDESGEQVEAIEDVTQTEAEVVTEEEPLQEDELEVGPGLDDDVDEPMISDEQEVSLEVGADDVAADIDELLEIKSEMPDTGQDDELDIVLDEETDETVGMVDVEVPDDELLEIDDELAVQVTDDDLDVVIDDEFPDIDSIIAGADEALAGTADTDKDPLQETVALNDNDVADLEAAGLTGIVDLETDLGDELIELGDELEDIDLDADKKSVDPDEDVANIDDLVIDQLLESSKKS